METFITVNNTEYTVEFLLNAVKHYNEHLNKLNTPPLNEDIWKEIMLRSTSNTLKNLCLAHKICHGIYTNMTFWKDKFAHDSLPPLIVMKKYKVGNHHINVISSMNKLPKINEYILSYNKMFSYRMIAIKFANNMQIAKKRILSYYQADIEYIGQALWLPRKMIKYVMDEKYNDCILGFGYKKKKFYMEMTKDVEEDELSDEENKPIKKHLTKKEFIDYFTLMLYYESDYKYFDIGELTMDDLLRSTKQAKKVFPHWK